MGSYREVTYREVDLNEKDILPVKKIVWKVNVACPYYGDKCSYIFDEIRFKTKEVICDAGPECGRSFIIRRPSK